MCVCRGQMKLLQDYYAYASDELTIEENGIERQLRQPKKKLA
jgi:hypothetical protein